jgi:hypothetical protein
LEALCSVLHFLKKEEVEVRTEQGAGKVFINENKKYEQGSFVRKR